MSSIRTTDPTRARPRLARVFAGLVLALGLIDVLARVAAHRARLDTRPVDIQSRDALRAVASTLDRGPAAAFIGSSFVFGRHLESTHGEGWPAFALAGRYAAVAQHDGRAVNAVNLGVNGVLFDELDCVAAEALAHRPDVLFVNVSPRPFAGDFGAAGDDAEARTNRGLCADHRRFIDRATAPLRDFAFDHVALLHYRDIAQFTALSAPPRLALVAALRRRVGLATPGDAAPAPAPAPAPVPTATQGDAWDEPASAEEAAVLREMAWRIPAARRYDSIEVRPEHPQAASLRALVLRLSRAAPTRAVLFYVEEDIEKLSQQANVPHFEQQRDAFIAMVAAIAGPLRVPFAVIRRSEVGPHFVDHVHLDAEGYRRVAERLYQLTATGHR